MWPSYLRFHGRIFTHIMAAIISDYGAPSMWFESVEYSCSTHGMYHVFYIDMNY